MSYNTYPFSPRTSNRQLSEKTVAARRRTHEAMQSMVNNVNGPFLEVGGPTEKGYKSLNNITIPNGLIISNIDNETGVDMLADVRALPFGARKLGGVVVSCLSRIPEERANLYPDAATSFSWGDIYQADMYADNLLRNTHNGQVAGWNDSEVMSFSLRLSLLRQARRIVEPRGLLIAQRFSTDEIGLAETLGFEIMTEFDKKSEVVMQLNDMRTPAGRAIEHYFEHS
ncbi:MAG TPA: hypothetical protein VK978_04555 [Candidatus Saccharimonadales bacterium]|nr:hypothetical protein [Candidatus Saccharimonadales bacterium]